MPRKPQPPKEERQRIQFAYNADVDSPTGVLFQYLIKNERARSREGKHKGIDAISAFWKPFAYQEQGQLSEEELKAIARESVELLNRQITLISDTFEIASPTASAMDLKQEIRQAVTQAVTETVQQLAASGKLVSGTAAESAGAPPGRTPTGSHLDDSEGVDFDEDALLGTLLDDATIAA
jgi:hypothetical protein